MSSPHFNIGQPPRAPLRRRNRGSSVPNRTRTPVQDQAEGPQAVTNEDTATETQQGRESPKRARIDASVTDPDKKANQSPLAAAKEHIESHIASLHDGIADLLLNRGTDHINLIHRILSKEQNILRMEADEGYIPVSARVNFKLSPLKSAEEMTEFLELQTRNIAFTETVKIQYRKHIIECAKIDRKALRAQLNKEYCESIHQVVSIFHTAQSVDDSLSHPLAIKLFTENSISILKHIDLESAAFCLLYKTTLDVGTLTEAQIAVDNPRIGEIKRAIESVFPAAIDKYIKQLADNNLALTIKKQAREALLEQKTEDATMLVDDELPVDRLQLNELIQKEAEKLARKLIKDEVATQLKKTTKNSSRGPKKGANQRKANTGRGTGRGSSGRGRDNRQNRTTQNQSSRSTNQSNGRGRSKSVQRKRTETSDNEQRRGKTRNSKPRSNSRSKKKGNNSSRRPQRS